MQIPESLCICQRRAQSTHLLPCHARCSRAASCPRCLTHPILPFGGPACQVPSVARVPRHPQPSSPSFLPLTPPHLLSTAYSEGRLLPARPTCAAVVAPVSVKASRAQGRRCPRPWAALGGGPPSAGHPLASRVSTRVGHARCCPSLTSGGPTPRGPAPHVRGARGAVLGTARRAQMEISCGPVRRDGVRKLKKGLRRSGCAVDFLTSSSGINLRLWIESWITCFAVCP